MEDIHQPIVFLKVANIPHILIDSSGQTEFKRSPGNPN